MLCWISCQLVVNVAGQHIGPVFKGQAFHTKCWSMKVGLTPYLEISVKDYQPMPCDMPEEQRPYLGQCTCLKSLLVTLCKTKKLVSCFHLMWQWECWEMHFSSVLSKLSRVEKTHLKVSNRHSLLCSDIWEFVSIFIIPWNTNFLTSV
jgi:hypothetical protein